MALVNCKECKKEVSSSAKTCPHCGVKDPATPLAVQIGAGLIIVLFFFAIVGYFVGESPDKEPLAAQIPEKSIVAAPVEKPASTQTTKKTTPASDKPKTKEWYEGGTLHNASALEWQKATYANKLATSADMVAVVWNKDLLKPELSGQIKNMRDIRKLAESLTAELDKAFEPLPDKNENRQVYANQTVNEFSIMLMIMAGWLK